MTYNTVFYGTLTHNMCASVYLSTNGPMPSSQFSNPDDMNRYLRQSLDGIFKKNRDWVASKTRTEPAFFEKLAAGQAPNYL